MPTLTADPSHESSRPISRRRTSISTPREFLLLIQTRCTAAKTIRDQRAPTPQPVNYSEPGNHSL